MSKAYYLLFLFPAAVVYACGGSDSTGVDGGTDAEADNTVPSDSGSKDTSTVDTGADTGGNDATVDTGADTGTDATTNDSGSDTGVADAGSDSAINVTCLHPADCIDGGSADAAYSPDSGEVCCGTLVTTGTAPACTAVTLTTQCSAPSSCASNIPFSCGTDTVRGCQHAAECAETNYDQCCTFNGGDAGNVQFCVGSLIAQFAVSCLDAGQ
jgi:hypothetical protein